MRPRVAENRLSTLDYTIAQTTATSLIHSKVDYCNSLFLNLPRSQLDHLQCILNSAARAVSKTPKFTHISPVLKSLHWLKIDQRIHYKVLSLTYKNSNSTNPPIFTIFSMSNLTLLLVLQLPLLLNAPKIHFRLKITDRSFTHYVPVL